MSGRGGVVNSDNNFHLTKHLSGDVLIGANNVHSSGSLTVKSHNLSEGLAHEELVALFDEISESLSVLVQTSGGESLVSSVEEAEKLLLLANFGDSLPFGKTGVNSSWVVGAGVEEHGGSSLGVSQIFQHSFDVETSGLSAVVSVLSHLESSSLEDFVVVSPGGVAHVDGATSELSQKLTSNSQSSSSGKSLGRHDSGVVD